MYEDEKQKTLKPSIPPILELISSKWIDTVCLLIILHQTMSPPESKLKKQQKEFNILLNFPDEIQHLIMDNLKSLDLLNYVRAVPKLQNRFKENYRVFTDRVDRAEFSFLSNRFCFKLCQTGKKRNVDKFQIFNGTVMFEIFGNQSDRGYRDDSPIDETVNLIENITKINTNGVEFNVKAHTHTSLIYTVRELLKMSNDPDYSLKYISFPKLEFLEIGSEFDINKEVIGSLEGLIHLRMNKFKGVANLDYFPNLRKLTIQNVKELSFQKSSIFPKVLELRSFHGGISFTSSMCQKLKYLYIDLLDRNSSYPYTHQRERNPSKYGLKDLEFPNLKEIEIQSGQIINEIRNISAPLLKKFNVNASSLELCLENLSFPALESIILKSNGGLIITDIANMHFPQLKSFEITSFYDNLDSKRDHPEDTSELPFHFLKNAKKGYPTDTTFDNLKSLKITGDRFWNYKEHGEVPRMIAPNLQYLELESCQVSKSFFDENSNFVDKIICRKIPALDISNVKLPCLEVIDISVVESEVNLSNCYLPSLTSLMIKGLDKGYNPSMSKTNVTLPELNSSPKLENIDISYIKALKGLLTNKSCPKLAKLRFYKCVKDDSRIEVVPQENLKTMIIDTSDSSDRYY
ncbi:hypothetical protein BN7_620 [Wickerhamomyces ciferrii]|uniref:F-box domain-containing protein n=1 Tax=Wickerhamomyces ciferrii (strain ATCC 14091 / BCRC 22168 / CBS 111 / JCM 3599 / NBRC 0793 / NRRL Y-1031 F-60-10) TaxID=1206466 RepID=K0KIX1_WICCF|nr:uncharacterized protein BN7_620 [Wickerhamomyces ciferrii]CCH41083.1 hypothetical protein BN7_620 [Wickerhamomyces ciferrii]